MYESALSGNNASILRTLCLASDGEANHVWEMKILYESDLLLHDVLGFDHHVRSSQGLAVLDHADLVVLGCLPAPSS